MGWTPAAGVRFGPLAGVLHCIEVNIVKKCLPFAIVWNAAFLVAAVRADEWQPAMTHAMMVGVLEWKNGLGGFSKRHRKDQELRDLLVERGVPEENITLL